MSRKRILFICGSNNQTTQMHQIAAHLGEYETWFTPYYQDPYQDILRKVGFLDFTIGGNVLRRRCLDYLERHGLAVDLEGRRGNYDLVVTCSDLIVPSNIRDRKIVLVQEGILDPKNVFFHLTKRFRWFPRWVSSTSVTGLSHAYVKFCVASEGYREEFEANGCDPRTLVVTGIPNFDDCDKYRDNDFPHHGYVLACTSDTRETFKRDDRKGFIRRVVEIARGRPIIFKLHPNEKRARAEREIARWAPGALVYQDGSAEEMIANSDAVVCQYSSTVFVGLALEKECHSYFDVETLRRLVPLQNRRAALDIGQVCRGVLEGVAVDTSLKDSDAEPARFAGAA